MAEDYEIAAAQLLVSIARVKKEPIEEWILELSSQKSNRWPESTGFSSRSARRRTQHEQRPWSRPT